MARTIIKEIAENSRLQVYIDESQARFAPIFWPSLLTVQDEDSLRWDAIIGNRKSGVAGNVTAYNVSAPQHGRDALREEGGKIPSIRGKRIMDENDLMRYINMRRQVNPNMQRMLALIYDDVEFCSIAPHKRVDWMITKLLSNAGKLSFTNENNVGVVTQYDVDFGLPTENLVGTQGAPWSNSNDSTPLTDLRKAFFEPMADLGLSGGVIRMHPAKVFEMIASKEVRTILGGWSNQRATQANIEITTVNQWLSANNYPTIRPFNASIGIENDGKVKFENPWNKSNVVWTPDGVVGQLHQAPVVEREMPTEQVTYAEFMGNLVKKWGETDPKRELTGYEMNAFPSLTIADEMRVLNTDNTGDFEAE